MARRRQRAQFGSSASAHAKYALNTQEAAIGNARQAVQAVGRGDCKGALRMLYDAVKWEGKYAAHSFGAGNKHVLSLPETVEARELIEASCLVVR